MENKKKGIISSSYQYRQIKYILIFLFSALIIFYFFIFDKEPLPKDIKKQYKHWVKEIDRAFSNIKDQSEFKTWVIKQNFRDSYQVGQLDYRTKLESKTSIEDSCTWNIYLEVSFGISVKGGPRQYVNKAIQHNTTTTPDCPENLTINKH